MVYLYGRALLRLRLSPRHRQGIVNGIVKKPSQRIYTTYAALAIYAHDISQLCTEIAESAVFLDESRSPPFFLRCPPSHRNGKVMEKDHSSFSLDEFRFLIFFQEL